ncbi:MAG: DUF3088 family protein [Pseudomonadota bacterium]
MNRDILFVLPPGFMDNGRREFCPECAELAGLIACYPFVREALDIRHVGIDQPREPITKILGEGNFNAPTMVLALDTDLPADIDAKSSNGRLYLDSISTIAKLFSARYGMPNRRGDT